MQLFKHPDLGHTCCGRCPAHAAAWSGFNLKFKLPIVKLRPYMLLGMMPPVRCACAFTHLCVFLGARSLDERHN